MEMDMIEKLNERLRSYQIDCTDSQLQQFATYYDLLIDWNKKMNLTAITDPEEVIVKHFFDSITPAFFYPFSQQRMIDIGAGAGFPSIPLKICFPDLKLTLLDSLNKRITFLQHLIETLNLKNVDFIHGRAEEIARKSDLRESFDIAISRAVAKLNVLAELSLPFIKLKGSMIALKGARANEEIAEAQKAIQLLGGVFVKEHNFDLPEHFGERTIIIINKTKSTPIKYPRKSGTPNREPIQ